MTRHTERDSVTGRYMPRAVVPEFEDEVSFVDAPDEYNDPRGVHIVGESRFTGRVDTERAYDPMPQQNPLSKYQRGPGDNRLAHTLAIPGAVRKAIMIDAQTGQRLDGRIVQVEQPEQIMGGPELPRPSDYRLMSKRTFGHLDQEND